MTNKYALKNRYLSVEISKKKIKIAYLQKFRSMVLKSWNEGPWSCSSAAKNYWRLNINYKNTFITIVNHFAEL